MTKEFFAFHGEKRRPRWRNIVIITLAVLEGFFTTLPYGWASLVVVLKSEEFFAGLCHENATATHGSVPNETLPLDLPTTRTALMTAVNSRTLLAVDSTAYSDGQSGEYRSCSAQDERLNLVFTIAISMTLCGCFPTGAMYDYLGPRKTRLICSILFETAVIMLIFANKDNPNLLFPAMAILGVIGAPILVSLFEVANSFPKYRFTLVSLLNGACMMSTTVFLAVQKLYEYGIPMQMQFIFILFMTSVLFLVDTFFVVPAEKVPCAACPSARRKYYPELFDEECVRLKEHSYRGKELIQNGGKLNHQISQVSYCASDLNIFHRIPVKTYSAFMNQIDLNILNTKKESFLHTIKTPMFIWFVVWSTLMTFREFYFIGTLNAFLGFITNGNTEKVDHYTAIFGYISFGVIFLAPLVGLLMDAKGDCPLYTSIPAIMITTSHTVLYSLAVLVPILEVQWVTFALLTIQRGFIHGVLSSFIGMAFPQDHYGKFYGVVYLIAGLVTLLQNPLFALSQTLPDEDPFYVNLGILVVTVLAHGHPMYVWYYCDRAMRRKLREKRIEEKTTTSLLMDADGYI
ncbi:equilibrative nucleobase transporter 1-like [Ptychodera flava]|uniref:equilibrative nucleobase transporter 1-like n=1 Tax=Ptychodera flava TaxID=63121 RepID=UPI003969F8FD